MQSLGARFAHDLISLDYAADHGLPGVRIVRRRLPVPRHGRDVAGGRGSAGPGAAAQRARAVGRTGVARAREPLRRRAAASPRARASRSARSSPPPPIENAMLVHAAFGGSTNLLLHIPAIAAAAGLKPPPVDDWIRINRATPRLVDALPNGPRGFATAQVFMAGGVPEVMLHLRRMGLLNGACAHRDRRHARHHARLVGIERAAPGGARTACVRGGHRSRPGHHGARRGAPRRAHQHGRVPARQSRAAGLGDQGDRDRSIGDRRRRRLSASRSGPRVHRRARRDSRRSRARRRDPCARAT